jgi:putative transposase
MEFNQIMKPKIPTYVETHSRTSPRYKNKYRVESTRLKNWDYSSDGYYFITICTKNRACVFGNVIDEKLILSEIGKIVETEWLKSFEMRADLICDEYCIMPNHIHGIVVIHNADTVHNVETVETHVRASLQPNDSIQPNDSLHFENPSKPIAIRTPKSISSFVSGFKSSATKKINEMRGTPCLPVWQSRFYDHIIRREDDLNRIRIYIMNNPQNWDEDDLNI